VARKGRVAVELVTAVKNAEEQVMRNEDISDAHLGTDANGPSLAEKPSSCVSRPIARGQSANVKVLLAGVAADVPAATRTLVVA
jgi:hypothetical protein